MSDSCTIYSAKPLGEFLDHFSEEGFRDVSDPEIRSFQRNYFEGSIRISLREQIEQGDSFSKLLRGTWNYFENIETQHQDIKERLAARILATKTAVGIFCKPGYQENDKRMDLIFKLAESFDGMIFNGPEMLDEKGRVILDSEGNSGV